MKYQIMMSTLKEIKHHRQGTSGEILTCIIVFLEGNCMLGRIQWPKTDEMP
jgi:hypothetical protein